MNEHQKADCAAAYSALHGYKVWESFRAGYEAGFFAAANAHQPPTLVDDNRDPGDEA